MSKTRDKSKSLWAVFPSNDPNYKKWNESYPTSDRSKRVSEKLKTTVWDVFNNVLLLDEMFVDLTKRDKVRFSYKILTWLGKRDLKVKVRLPEKPNIYYVENDWYKTGDYYVDPVEIWRSDHGQNVLHSWKGTCSVQKPVIDNDDILNSIKHQYEDTPEDLSEKLDRQFHYELSKMGYTMDELDLLIDEHLKKNKNDDK